MEKSPLLPSAAEPSGSAPRRSKASGSLWIIVICITLLYWFKGSTTDIMDRDRIDHRHHHPVKTHGCEQVDPLFPSSSEKLDAAFEFLSSEAFRNASILRHSGAVQIATESFDDMGAIGEDERWDVFYQFAEYLETTFPQIHGNLKLEKVNTHGLLYTWQGSHTDLKPLVLMAHQDVVPVPESTVNAWTHPPFSGFFDGRALWGRGSQDCKSSLIAVMESIEQLLLSNAGFVPKRTVIMSFGFDEEISGGQGAGHIAPVLLERYGEDGVAAIVDEGAGVRSLWGTIVAQPGVGEKGMTDVNIVVRMPGGHSSIPPPHTSIGVLSELLCAVEAEQYPTYLADDNPVLSMLQCGARYAPDFPESIKKLLDHRHIGKKTTCPKKHDRLAMEVAKIGPGIRYLMETSQAIDIISGGAKSNALPERVSAVVNHRINIGDTPETVWSHLTELAKPIAKKYNLTLHAFDGAKEEPLSMSLQASEKTLEVAPITPTDITGVTPYSILAGTTRAALGADIIVSPGMMTGNTDTKHYWNVTKHIFRYSPGYDPEWHEKGLGNIHTVNEHTSVAHHISMVKFFTLFIRNMNDAEL